jgi:hypothetical protein
MPPQQPERLLDFFDDGLDFGTHFRDQDIRDQDIRDQVPDA